MLVGYCLYYYFYYLKFIRSGFIPLLVGTIMYVGMWALRSFSERTVPGFSFQSGYAVVSTFPYMFFAEWLQELAVHSALNVIHLANFHSLTYINRWCWLLHKWSCAFIYECIILFMKYQHSPKLSVWMTDTESR